MFVYMYECLWRIIFGDLNLLKILSSMESYTNPKC